MRVTYDPEADAMYLYFTERDPGAPDAVRTEEVAHGINLDFDERGCVIGVEVLSVSRLPGAKPMQMAFEVVSERSLGGAAAQ